MRRFALVLLLVAAACTQEPVVSESTTTTTGETTTTGAQTEVCLTGSEPFSPEGALGAFPASGADAALVTRIHWQEFPACERLEIELGTAGGAPALESPAIAGFFIRDAGVLRVTLGSRVEQSHVSDQVIGTKLVDRVFVVRSLDGTVFVDIHLAAPALARVSSGRGPGRALVDLRPGGGAYTNPALATPAVVVVEPAGGAVTFPFSVGGYVRGDIPLIEATLTSGSGETSETSVPPATDEDLWRSFVVLFPNGPTGAVTLDLNGLTAVQLDAS